MNNIERARCIIERYNKCHPNQGCCCFIPSNGGAPGNISLTIGTVTTSEAGSPASASITGTSPNFVLNFTLPRGYEGPAPDIEIGTVTTGAPGTEASVTITSVN